VRGVYFLFKNHEGRLLLRDVLEIDKATVASVLHPDDQLGVEKDPGYSDEGLSEVVEFEDQSC